MVCIIIDYTGSLWHYFYIVSIGGQHFVGPTWSWVVSEASYLTQNAVCKVLGMVSPSIIAEVPNKLNMKYIVRINSKCLEDVFAPLAEEIRVKRSSMDRVIVYCRNYDSCTKIYLYLKYLLKGEIR